MFDDPGAYLWLIPGLPLAASVLTAFLGPRLLRGNSHWPCVLAPALACLLSLGVPTAVAGGTTDLTRYYTWFQVPPPSPVDVGFTLRADGLTAVMLLAITFVGTLI